MTIVVKQDIPGEYAAIIDEETGHNVAQLCCDRGVWTAWFFEEYGYSAAEIRAVADELDRIHQESPPA